MSSASHFWDELAPSVERNTTACLSDRGVGDNESDSRLIGVIFRTGEANDKFSGHAPLHRGVE